MPKIWEHPFEYQNATNSHATQQSTYFIHGTIIYQRNFVPPDMDFIGTGSDMRLNDFSYYTVKYKAFLQNFHWFPLREFPIFLGILVFYWIKSHRWDTTGITLSNLNQMSSAFLRWYILLLHNVKFTLHYPRWVW